MEKYETGIRRIINAFRNYGLKLPEFKDVPKGFMVVVYCRKSKHIKRIGSKKGGYWKLSE